ncbi:hypothetical protein Tco_0797703 [Tanacetum coccineum]
MDLMRAAAQSTCILAPRSRTLPLGTQPILPIPLLTSSLPLPLPSNDHRVDVLEAMSTGGFRADYGFVGTLDVEIRSDPDREVGYGITDFWVDPAEAIEEIPPTTLAKLKIGSTMPALLYLLRERLGLPDRHGHSSEVMTLRTMVSTLQAKNGELRAADRRRQTQLLETLTREQWRYTRDAGDECSIYILRKRERRYGFLMVLLFMCGLALEEEEYVVERCPVSVQSLAVDRRYDGAVRYCIGELSWKQNEVIALRDDNTHSSLQSFMSCIIIMLFDIKIDEVCMSTCSTSSNLFSPLRDPESLIRRIKGPPPAGPPPPNNNGPPLVVRPNGLTPRSIEELCQPSINGRGEPIAPIPIQATDFGLRHHMIQQDTSATRDETSRTISSTTTTESPEVVRQLEMMNKNFLDMMRQIQSVKSVSPKCETCGGPHSFTECPAVDGYTQEAAYATTGNHNSGGNSYQPQGDRNMLSYRSNNYLGPPGFNQPNVQNNQNRYNQNQGRGQNFNQGNNNYQAPNFQAPNYQAQVGPSNDLSNYMKTNDVNMRAMQNQINNMKTELKNEFQTSMKNQNNELRNIMSNELKNVMTNFLQMQNPSGSGSLPSNTVANPRGDVKAITTRSGVAYDGPTIPPTPSPLPKEVERETEATKDKVQTTSSESTAHVQPPVVQIPILELEVALKSNPKPSIPYPSRLNDQKL